MPDLPLIDAATAIGAGRALVPPGPQLSRAEISEVVESLRSAAERSVQPVAEVTRLDVHAAGPMHVVDRPTWLRLNVEMALTMLAEASGEPMPQPTTLPERASAKAAGAQLGGVLAVLGTRILGQYLPFHTDPRLVLVAPNVAKIEREMNVHHGDFRLWVCLHEQTHRLQFARAPWLRAHLLEEVSILLDDEVGGRRRGRPRSLVEAVASPAQQQVFERVSAVMALLEGYADDMMDRVGPSVVPSVASIRAKFDKRRQRGGWTKVVNTALGMDLKLAQYRDGAAFCREVIDLVGVDGLNVVYDSARNLPSPREVSEPRQWVRRVHG